MAKKTDKQNTNIAVDVSDNNVNIETSQTTADNVTVQELLQEIETLKSQLLQQNNDKTEVKDLHELVPCRSVVKGKLIYKSPKSFGYTVIWNNFGDVEYLELGELIAMRNVYPRFFQEPWIIIDNVDIIKYLNVEKYYKNMIDIEHLDDVFKQSTEQFVETLQKIPRGFKDLIVHRALELIKSGELDSIAKIKTIEQMFNVDLSVLTQ